MSELLFEHMIRAEANGYVCRIWRLEGHSGISNTALKHLAEQLMKFDRSLPGILTALVEHERVNSVEIISRDTGDGVCVHKDWP